MKCSGRTLGFHKALISLRQPCLVGMPLQDKASRSPAAVRPQTTRDGQMSSFFVSQEKVMLTLSIFRITICFDCFAQ